MSFKIGDWIRTKGRTNHPSYITKISRISNAWNPCTRDYSGTVVINGTADTTLQDIESWQPKKDEWCWFFNNKKEIPKLGKLKYKANNQYTAYMTPKASMSVQNFKFCEPFIGQLPSILK